MAKAEEIIDWANDLLQIDSFDDYGPNGLQIPGRSDVELVVSGVSANLALINAAVGLGADLVIVHHGLFWNFHPRSFDRVLAARVRPLLTDEIGLAGYHLPLDAHSDIGNNALICKRLGFDLTGTFSEHRGANIGAVAQHSKGVGADDLFDQVAKLTDRKPLVFADGPPLIKRLGVVSGAAASSITEAAQLGLDAFITGEPSEHVMAEAAERGIHFIAAGHYATETFGIQALGNLIAEHFSVEHRFVDVPNPI